MNNIDLMDEKELVDREAAYNLGFIPKQGMPTDRDTQVARLQDYMVSDRDADAAERVRQYYGEALPIKNISQDAMEYFVGAAFARQHGISGSPEAYWLGQKLDMPEVESREDLYGLMGRDLMERTRKGWEEQKKLVEERQTAMTGLLKDMVTASDGEGRAALQERFSEAYDRGVFSEADWTSVQNARDAFETLQKHITKDFETAGANALTKSFEGEFIFDKLYNDPLAQALFLTALQERVQDLKTDVQERAFYDKAAKMFSAAGKELAARVAGGHYKEYVTDEQVEEFNAKLPQYKAWQQILQMAPGADYGGAEALPGDEAMKMQSFEHAARMSGQLNADGTLRKMTQAEWKRTGELNAFRSELYKAISGAYDVDDVVAKLAKMMPDSLVYLVPLGSLAAFASERTRNLALSLADGEDYVSAEVKATVNAAIQSTVEKMAFGGVGVTKWAPGMDWLMSRKVVGRALGKIYGTTVGRMGMGLVAGSLEETFAEPLASLLLRGAYNAVAMEEFRLDDPLSEYQAEMEEMLKPEQLLVTALYGLLLGGVNVTGHRQAAADYREFYKELVAAGADEGRAAQVARDDAAVANFKAAKRLFEETLKEKPASVMGYLAEMFPQLQGLATMEGFFSKMDLPRLIPAENGQVKVQTRDADGNVQELVMSKESAQLLVQAKLEELTAKEMSQFADAALANAMVGAMSKKTDKWDIEVVAETMDHEYFERLANAAGVRTHGKAWKERMLVARHDYEEAHGKVTDEEWEKIQQRLVSRVNRTGVRGKDGRLRTLFRVARGGFGAMEVLEDITEDNLVRDMEANGRTLDYYINNLRELEAALGKQGAFLRKLKDSDTEGDRRMAVVEAMGKLVQSKVLADTAKNSNMFSAALNAFLEMIRSWVLQAKAMMKLGAAVNKVLTDAEAAKNLDAEFVADVERLAQQDIEFLRELQLEEGLKAMQRVLEARQEAKTDRRVKSRRKRSATPVLDEAEAEHGEEVREAARKKAEVQAKVDADVAAADAALEGEMDGSMSVTDTQERGLLLLEDYEDTDTSFCVVGENADNWDEIKDRAFRGRDDGLLRVELDASQAKLKKGRFVSTKNYIVDDLLDFPELMRAYPELRYFPVSIKTNLGRGVNGGLRSTSSGRMVDIALATKIIKRPGKALSTLLHEIQHWIQVKEDFARGGNESSAREAYDNLSYFKHYKERKMLGDLIAWMNAPEMALLELEDLRKEVAEYEGNEEELENIVQQFNKNISAYSDYPDALFFIDDLDYDYEQLGEVRSAIRLPELKNTSEESIAACEDGLRAAVDRHTLFPGLEESARKIEQRLSEDAEKETDLKQRLAGKSDYELYKRLAGEIESRNVQKRRWMSADERAELPFNETLDHPGEALISHSVTDPAVEEYRDNLIEFNIVTAKDETSREFQRIEMKAKGLTDAEQKAYFAIVDRIANDVMRVMETVDEKGNVKYPSFQAWQKMAAMRYEEKKGSPKSLLPRVSSFKKNGEYKVNIDLGTVCVKREMMTMLTDLMIAEGFGDRFGVSQIEQIKDLLKAEGIATACDICFVEARRIRALQQAHQLSFYWNAVRAGAGIDGELPIGMQGELTDEQVAKLVEMTGKLTDEQVAEWEEKTKGMTKKEASKVRSTMVAANQGAALKRLVPEEMRREKGVDLGLSTSMAGKLAKLFLEDSSLAGKAALGDFFSLSKMDFFMRTYPHTGLRSLLASAFGASTAKPLEGFNLYDELSWKKIFRANALEEKRKELEEIGGGRVQSFTDFNPILFLDYYQMVFDFAWRGLPLQAYTKVASFVELFGQTGIKINMSLLADVADDTPREYAGLETKDGKPVMETVEVNGKMVTRPKLMWHKDSFPINLAFQYRKDKSMHRNVGTVVVGMSDAHIRALLDRDDIDMVIPYHRSGMPTATLIKTGWDKATDYTAYQNTKKRDAKDGDDFKDTFSYNATLRELKSPKKAAAAYLKYCDQNNLVPKFEQFRDHPNYYKLLEDFRGYDRNGRYAEQKPLKTKLPKNWRGILEEALRSREAETIKMKTLLHREDFLAKVRAILRQTPMEGNVRKVMVARLNNALAVPGKGDAVKTMKASQFDELAREMCTQNMNKEEADKQQELLRLHNGIIYGFTKDGVIYLKENTFNANTPAHEFTHVWAKVAQKANPQLWAEGVALLKKDANWASVVKDPLYWNIRNNENAIASEVLARIVGELNEQRVRKLVDPNAKPLEEEGIRARILKWVEIIWKNVRSLFDADNGVPLTLQEFSNMPLKDLWDETRNKRFNEYVRDNLSKNAEELQVEMAAEVDDASASLVNIDEEMVAAEVVAAGQGFKANLAYSEAIMKEMRSAMQRLRRVSGKTRSDREDAVAAMGTMVQMVKAAVAYLPQGYRFSVHPYLKRLEVLAEMAASGDIDLTKDMASKALKKWLKEQQDEQALLEISAARQGVTLESTMEEIVKDHGKQQLAEAVESIMNRVATQLRKHAKNRAVAKIDELVERMRPKKDPKSGKMKGGKMSADSYRDLEDVYNAMLLSGAELDAAIAAKEAELNTPGLSEEQRSVLESELAIYSQFGDLDGMSAEEAVAAYEALRMRILMHRFEWDNIMAERRHEQRKMVHSVVSKVGEVRINRYNEEKRMKKPTKRTKRWGDMLSSATTTIFSMRNKLGLRGLADNLLTRATRAGELVKQWERERWVKLDALSKKTIGKSWRESMADILQVKETGVRFERPKYREVSLRVDELRELLAMTPEEREADRKQREKDGGVLGETILTERDVQELGKELARMERVSELLQSLSVGERRAEIKRMREAGETVYQSVLKVVKVDYIEGVQVEENLKLSKNEALYAILMYEQPTYTERMEAQGYTPEVIAGLKQYIGEGVLQFGYGLREMFAQQGDRIAAVYEKEFGVPFPREENYFAARWNVTERKGSPEQQLLASMTGTPGAGKGWQKQRVQHNLKLDMTKGAVGVFLQATQITDTWMATQDIISDFNAWTRDERFDAAMNISLGADGYQNLKDWIDIMETGGVKECVNMGASQDVINGLYGSSAVAILGWRLQTLLKQTPAIFNGLFGAHDISTAEWMATLAKMKHGEAPMSYERMLNSELIQSRMQGKFGAMAGQALRAGDIKSSKMEDWLLAAMLPMEKVDARCTAIGLVPVWNVYYARAIAMGATHEMAEQSAWEQTAIAANLASQPVGWLNKSKISQHRNPLIRSFFHLLSENMSKFAMCRDMWQGGHKGAAFRAWMIYGAANTLISALLDCLQGDPEEWEKAQWWEYLPSLLYGPAGGMPFIGEVLSWVGTGLILNLPGYLLENEEMQKASSHAGVARSIVDMKGAWNAGKKIAKYLTDDEDQSFAEYTREVSKFSRTLAVGTGWMMNGLGYFSTLMAVITNPVDLGARIWRSATYESEE